MDTFPPDEILKNWHWKGRPLSPEEIGALKQQSKAWLDSRLWLVLKNEIRYQAYKSLMEKGETAEDLRACKTLNYFTQVIENKLREMSSEESSVRGVTST